MLDPLESVIRRLLAEWPEIRALRVAEILREDYGYSGSVDLVKRRLATLRPAPVRPIVEKHTYQRRRPGSTAY